MRTLRMSLAWTVTLALLGGLGGAALAQDVEPMGPSEPDGASIFTMRQVAVEDVPWPESVAGPHGSLRWQGPTDVWAIESSDPRLSGKYSLVGNGEAWPLDEEDGAYATVMTGAVRIENADGMWTGTRVLSMGTDFADCHHVEGAGAYEGLTAVFHSVVAEARGDQGFMTYAGVVIPGPLPDYPELPAE